MATIAFLAIILFLLIAHIRFQKTDRRILAGIERNQRNLDELAANVERVETLFNEVAENFREIRFELARLCGANCVESELVARPPTTTLLLD